MKIYSIVLYGCDSKVAMHHILEMDILIIHWQPLIIRADYGERKAKDFLPELFLKSEYDDRYVVWGSLPGTIINTVEVLVSHNDVFDVRGLQLYPISKFPFIPRGNITVNDFLNKLSCFEGFEQIRELPSVLLDRIGAIPIAVNSFGK